MSCIAGDGCEADVIEMDIDGCEHLQLKNDFNSEQGEKCKQHVREL